MPSDTHTDDGELTIEKMRRAYSSLQDDYEAGLIVDLIHHRERAAKKEVLGKASAYMIDTKRVWSYRIMHEWIDAELAKLNQQDGEK